MSEILCELSLDIYICLHTEVRQNSDLEWNEMEFGMEIISVV